MTRPPNPSLSGTATVTRLPLAALGVLLATAPAGAADPPKESVVMRSIRNCARIETPDGASGTGWVLDAERRIVVTNHHVVATGMNDHSRPGFRRERVAGIHNSVAVTFPAYREDMSLIAEKSYYVKNAAKLIKGGLTVRGTVIDADEARDLAVVVVDKLPAGVKAFPLAAKSQNPGDEHFHIGCPALSDFFWVYGSGKVRARGFQQWTNGPPLHARRACQVLNTDSQSNPGDSGGPVINNDGEIVGVTQGYNTNARSISFAIDLSEIKAYAQEIDGVLSAKTSDEYRKRAQFYLRRDRPHMALADYDAAILDLTARKQPLWEVQLELSAAIRALNDLDISRIALPGFVNDPNLDVILIQNLKLAVELCEAARADKACPPAKALAELCAVQLAGLPAEAFIPVELKGDKWRPVIERGKNDPDYQKALAEAQKKHDETWGPKIKAIAFGLEAALKADPKATLAYQTRARLEGRKVKPDWGQVIQDRTAAVKLLNTILARNSRSYLDRAEAYAGNKEYAKAAADCDAAIKIDPRSAVAHANKAAYLLAAGDRKAADAVAARLVVEFDDDGGRTHTALEPLNPDNWELLANIAHADGRFADQAIYLTKCLEVQKDHGIPLPRRLFADRGDAYAAQKLGQKAIYDYTTAIGVPDTLGDKKPQSAIEELYQTLYSIPALQKKISALRK